MKNKISRERLSSVGFEKVDPSLLEPAIRESFVRRQHAIELKLDGLTGAEIHRITGLPESEITRFFKRYTALTEEGIFWGESALIPQSRIVSYQRRKPLEKKGSEQKDGMSGALSYTLAKFPTISEKFKAAVFRTDLEYACGSRYDKRQLCNIFYDICAAAGLTAEDWPFNQARGARRTITRYIDKLLNDDFQRAALATGGSIALIHSKVGTGYSPFLESCDVYDLIEIDSYHVDAFFVLNISGDKRTKTKDVISRIWLMAAICRRSNAILATKFVFASEVRSQDLVDLICEAYVGGWAPREILNVKDLRYSELSGMPCYSVPKLRHHIWGGICLDNAMQHHANKVYELALHSLGFSINFGPLGQPARRPNIERLFKRIATKVMHQLPSTTGSSPADGRADAPEKAAIRYQIDVDDALEVMDVYTANYNGTPQGGMNKANSPLDILRDYCANDDLLIPATPESYINSVSLGSSTREVKVTGSIKHGIRPRIKLDQAIYTSTELANSPHLIGKKLTIRIKPHDYRYVEAYIDDGIYLGMLTVEASWRHIAHSVTTRKLVNRALAKKEFQIAEGQHPVLAWQKHLIANASPANARELKRLQEERCDTSQLIPKGQVEIVPEQPSNSVSERWRFLDIFN